MGNTDSIPVISQVKSLVQVASGDELGAKTTQQNFLRTGPIASQVYSAVLAIGVSIVLAVLSISRPPMATLLYYRVIMMRPEKFRKNSDKRCKLWQREYPSWVMGWLLATPSLVTLRRPRRLP